MHVLHCGRMPDHPEREPMEAWGEHANTTQRGVSWLAGGWQKKTQSSRTINLSEVSPKHKEAPCFPSGKTRVAEAGIMFDCRHGFKE